MPWIIRVATSHGVPWDMSSIWTRDMVGPFLVRQIAGLLLLVGLVALSVAIHVNPLDDLNGSFGLWALFALSMMAPARWLAWILAIDALVLAYLGTYWLLEAMRGNEKALSPGLGFLFAALCCLAGSWLAKRAPETGTHKR